MLSAILLALQLATSIPPIEETIRATEVPDTIRASFSVQMTSDTAVRFYVYDPRMSPGTQWQMLGSSGDDPELDAAAAAWESEFAPDARLFINDLRQHLGDEAEVDDFGKAWRIKFKQEGVSGERTLGIFAAPELEASAWIEPRDNRLMRIDFRLPAPVETTDDTVIERYDQRYLMDEDEEWGFRYVGAYSLDFKAERNGLPIEQSFSAKITSAEFFFNTPEEQAKFEAERQAGSGSDD